MKHKILAIHWFTPAAPSCFGISAIESHNGWKAYIGMCQGYDEEKDSQYIADHGVKLREPEARAFFPQFKDLEYKT